MDKLDLRLIYIKGDVRKLNTKEKMRLWSWCISLQASRGLCSFCMAKLNCSEVKKWWRLSVKLIVVSCFIPPWTCPKTLRWHFFIYSPTVFPRQHFSHLTYSLSPVHCLCCYQIFLQNIYNKGFTVGTSSGFNQRNNLGPEMDLCYSIETMHIFPILAWKSKLFVSH